MAVFIGNSLGPMFGGLITDLAGARINFLVTAVFLAFSAFIVFKNVNEEFIPIPKTTSIFKNTIPDFSVLASNRELLPLMIVIFFIQFSNSVVGPIIPLVVLDMTNIMEGVGSISGLIIGVASIGGAIGSVLAGKISGKLGYERVLLVCIAGAFFFYLPQGFATQPWQLVALRFISGFFMGGTMPTANALIALRAERKKQGAIYGFVLSYVERRECHRSCIWRLSRDADWVSGCFFRNHDIVGVIGHWAWETGGQFSASR